MGGNEAQVPVATKRMRCAGALMAAGVLTLVCACATADHGLENAADGSSSLVRRLWDSMGAGTQLDDALKEVGLVKLTKENAPGWLEDEVIGLDSMQQPIANGSFELLWFTRKGVAAEAMGSIRGELVAKGWSTCGADENGIESFVKTEGKCTWAMAECAQAGDDVACVLHIRHT